MKHRSIRWVLLAWYAGILVAALVALGAVILASLREDLAADVDRELDQWLDVTLGILEPNLAERLAEAQSALPAGWTFHVWGPDGGLLGAAGDLVLGTPVAEAIATKDRYRLHSRAADGGLTITVGQNIEARNHRIRRFLLTLTGAGSAIGLAAVVGGWIRTTRALAPIERMADTARGIAGPRPSDRIEEEHLPSELKGLGTTMNFAFDRLQDLLRRQVDFTADASHELRTPLAVLSSHLELAATRDKTVEALKDRIGVCREATSRMALLVDGLLTLARADSGELGAHRQWVDLSAVVGQVLEDLNPLVVSRRIELTHDLPPARGWVDRDGFRSIISNLLRNAVVHNRDAGAVHVSLTQAAGSTQIQIRDTGRGVTPDQMAHLFDRFFQGDSARSRTRGSGGLGLAVVDAWVRLHGGTVVATSTPDVGSEFTVVLPTERDSRSNTGELG